MNTLRLWLYFLIVRFLPETRCFALKAFLLRRCGAKVGNNVRIVSSARFVGNGKLIIGDDVWIGAECFISSVGDSIIEIGSHVDLAPQVMLITGTHEVDVQGLHVAGKGCSKSIKIGDGCWIGARSTVLPGVTFSKRIVVAAGSVVCAPIDVDNVLVAGNPASIKKVYT